MLRRGVSAAGRGRPGSQAGRQRQPAVRRRRRREASGPRRQRRRSGNAPSHLADRRWRRCRGGRPSPKRRADRDGLGESGVDWRATIATANEKRQSIRLNGDGKEREQRAARLGALMLATPAETPCARLPFPARAIDTARPYAAIKTRSVADQARRGVSIVEVAIAFEAGRSPSSRSQLAAEDRRGLRSRGCRNCRSAPATPCQNGPVRLS